MRRLFRCLTSAIIIALVSSCGTNPVTKKKEIQLVSESQEIEIGQQNYSPARQSQGGDFILDTELTEYVRSVGNKLVAASDRGPVFKPTPTEPSSGWCATPLRFL